MNFTIFLSSSGSWNMRLPILLALLGLFVHNAYLQCKNLILQVFLYTRANFSLLWSYNPVLYI